jgi:hypothetical protein
MGSSDHVALPDVFQPRRVVEVARTLNPEIGAIVRTYLHEEAA